MKDGRTTAYEHRVYCLILVVQLVVLFDTLRGISCRFFKRGSLEWSGF